MFNKLAPWLFCLAAVAVAYFTWPTIRVGIGSTLRDAGLCSGNVIDVPSVRRRRAEADTSEDDGRGGFDGSFPGGRRHHGGEGSSWPPGGGWGHDAETSNEDGDATADPDPRLRLPRGVGRNGTDSGGLWRRDRNGTHCRPATDGRWSR